MDFETEEFESIPLPDQVPSSSSTQTKGLSFLEQETQSETLAPNHSKSRTIQALLNQNQDLTSRLSVTLKKNVELEQRLENSDDQFQGLKVKFESTYDQTVIFKEKNKHLEGQISQLLEETHKQDNKFSELYNAYQEKISYIQKLSYRVHRFLKYRSRIRSYIRPLLNQLKTDLANQRSQLSTATQKILEQEQTILNLKTKIQESVDHIQQQAKTFEIDQAELVSYHEGRFQAITTDNEKLTASLMESMSLNRDQKVQLEALRENEVELTNKSIYFERMYTDLKAEFDTTVASSQETQSQDAQRIKKLESHAQQLSEKLNETIQYAQSLYNEHIALNDQHSSLQILFQENLSKAEDYKKRLLSLEQMNKELSQSLLENRKKNDALEEKLAKTQEDFKRKLESFQYRFQKPNSDLSVTKAVPQAGQKELLHKIQNLLSEIQTGHSGMEATLNSQSIPVSQANTNELLSEGGEIGQSIPSSAFTSEPK